MKREPTREVVRCNRIPIPATTFPTKLEFYFKYLPWGLRGVTDGQGYPPPAYPPV